MKSLKKIFAIVLALVMALSLAVPVMAADDDLVITIRNTHTQSSAGHVYEAYQIFAGTVSTDGNTLSNITWGADIDGAALITALKADTQFVINNANIFANVVDAEDVADVLALYHNRAAIVERFAQLADANLKTDAVPETSTEADAPYTIRIPAANTGYYLVKDKDGSLEGQVNKDYTKLILQVMGNASIEHKGGIPHITKQVSLIQNTSYSKRINTALNRTYYYKLTGTLPADYANYKTYEYKIVDTMSAGITYGEIKEAYILYADGSTVALTEDVHYTETATVNADNTTTLTLHFDNLKKDYNSDGTANDLNLPTTAQIIFVYSAKLNNSAVIARTGNPNRVRLYFSNNPNGSGTGMTNEDETHVYTFDLELIKIDGSTKNNTTITTLAGAEFVMYRRVGTDLTHEYAVVENGKFVDWTPYLTAADVPEGVTDYKLATTLVSDANGKIGISGLNATTYWLRETKTPDGYDKLLDDISINLEVTYNDSTKAVASMEIDIADGAEGEVDLENGVVSITVDNFKGSVLPETGGIGTTIFYIVGGLMFVAAAILLITKKRMSVK